MVRYWMIFWISKNFESLANRKPGLASIDQPQARIFLNFFIIRGYPLEKFKRRRIEKFELKINLSLYIIAVNGPWSPDSFILALSNSGKVLLDFFNFRKILPSGPIGSQDWPQLTNHRPGFCSIFSSKGVPFGKIYKKEDWEIWNKNYSFRMGYCQYILYI